VVLMLGKSQNVGGVSNYGIKKPFMHVHVCIYVYVYVCKYVSLYVC